MEILQAQKLTYTYAGQTEPSLVCDGFSLGPGELCVVCGPTGSGKTTLLRSLSKTLHGNGKVTGEVLVNGKADPSFGEVGYLPQDTTLTLTDRVLSELAFAGESAGFEQNKLRQAVAEVAGQFGLLSLLHRKTETLSGGETQLVSLAGATVTSPSLLLLDEPISRLDPTAAMRFLDNLSAYLKETGASAVAVEHRLDEILPRADRVIVVREGKCVFFGKPDELTAFAEAEPRFYDYLPQTVKATGCLTVAEGRAVVSKRSSAIFSPKTEPIQSKPELLRAKGLWFRHEKNQPDLLRGIDITLKKGEIRCIFGGNGTGKTTLLRLLSGFSKPDAGRVNFSGKQTVMLPQNVRSVFIRDSVRRELEGTDADLPDYDFTRLFDRNPLDLSLGEAQLLALRVALSQKPELLLLDEPTHGLDPSEKRRLSVLLRKISDSETGIVIVTHDPEFAAVTADSCQLLFDGELTEALPTREFLLNNRFYTTSAVKLTRGIADGIVTTDELCELLGNGQRGAK